MAPHSSTLAWKIPRMRSLVGCSPWGREESEAIEWLHFHFPLSCIGEGKGNPLQCSCLENPMDGEALWATVLSVCLFVCLFVFPLMGKAEWGGNPVCWWLGLYFYFVCCLDEASCTGCYWWLGYAESCIQVVSFVWVLTIWHFLGLVL